VTVDSFDPAVFGSYFTVNVTMGSTPPNPVQVLAPNPTRVAVLFALGNGSSGTFVQPGSAPLTVGGIVLPTTGYLEFYWARHGPLVGFSWWIGSVPPGQQYLMIEVLYKQPGT
jgi:hypothetical protein